MIRAIAGLFSNNLSTKLISIITALVLWMVVLGSQNVEVTKDVPLELIPSEELLPANEVPTLVNVRISGPKAFLRTFVERKESPIRINLRGTKPGVVTYRFMPEDFKVPLGVKVLWIQPPVLSVKLEPARTKEVPVRVELRGAPPEGARIGKIELDPRFVKVRATRARLEGLAELVSLPIDVSELVEDTERTLAFDLPTEEVQLASPPPKVNIQVIAAAPHFRLRNVPIRVLTSGLRALPATPRVTVFVRAPPRELKALDSSRISAEIDLRGSGKGTHAGTVKVTVPKRITLIRVVPSQVSVTLE